MTAQTDSAIRLEKAGLRIEAARLFMGDYEKTSSLSSLHRSAINFRSAGQLKAADDNFRVLVEKLSSLSEFAWLARVRRDWAMVALARSEYGEALELLEAALEGHICETEDRFYAERGATWGFIGRVHLAMQRPTTAIQSFRRADESFRLSTHEEYELFNLLQLLKLRRRLSDASYRSYKARAIILAETTGHTAILEAIRDIEAH